MNTDEMEKLYQMIGQSIADTIPDPWKSAQVDIDIEPGVVKTRGSYIAEEGNDVRSFFVNFTTAKQFKALYELMSEMPEGSWKHAKFEMNSSGHFNLSFEYS